MTFLCNDDTDVTLRAHFFAHCEGLTLSDESDTPVRGKRTELGRWG
jgi:hypothetical protein